MLKKNLISNFVGQGLAGTLHLIFIPVYLDLFGISAFGLIGIFNLALSWLAIFDFGISQTITRSMSAITSNNNKEMIHAALRTKAKAEKITFVFGVLLAVTAYASASLIASEWIPKSEIENRTIENCIKIIGFIVGLRVLENPFRATLLGLQYQLQYNAINVCGVLLRGGGAILIALLFNKSITFFFAWNLLASTLILCCFWISAKNSLSNLNLKQRGQSKFDEHGLNLKQKDFALGVFTITCLALILTQLDRLLLSKTLSLQEFGQFTVAATAAAVIFTLCAPISTAFFPQLSAAYTNNNQPEFAYKLRLSRQLVTVVSSACAITMCFFPYQILNAWTGDQSVASNAWPLLAIIAFGNLLNSLTLMPVQALLAQGKTKGWILVLAIGIIIYAPLLIHLVPIYGAIAAALLWSSLNLFIVYPGSILTIRRSNFKSSSDLNLEANYNSIFLLIVSSALIKLIFNVAIHLNQPSRIIDAAVALACFLLLAGIGILTAPLLRKKAHSIVARPARSDNI